MADNKKQPKKQASKKAVAKKTPAKKAPAKKKPVAKKAPAKKPGRPPKTSNPDAEFVKVKAKIEADAGELVDAARTLVTTVSGVAPQTVTTFVGELITANDVKSASLRKRVLRWFKRS